MDYLNSLSVPFILSFIFEGIGIWKNNKYFIFLSLISLILGSFVTVSSIPHSGSFGHIGPFWILFGIIAIILKNKIDGSKMKGFTKERVKEVGIIFVVVGILFSLVA